MVNQIRHSAIDRAASQLMAQRMPTRAPMRTHPRHSFFVHPTATPLAGIGTSWILQAIRRRRNR